ncbi:MAG: nucleotidyl transferase AbiEii/AbiGii toxin family protein [Candidatus Krumholzibacteriales bacterium]
MKDYLKEITEKAADSRIAGLLIREYFQARILEIIQESGGFETWAFLGGTALRFIYSIPRFSEDLDFSLSSGGEKDNFTVILKKVEKSFSVEGYRLIIKPDEERTVKSALFKFQGILHEIGLSHHQSEILSIKVEIDTNPPAGAVLETSLVRKHRILNLLHYDRGSLLAGKLYALLACNYVKGRDVYDLFWYLADRTWPEPNLELLNNSLAQTGWKGERITSSNWKSLIMEKLSGYNWNEIVRDVRPFLEDQKQVDMLTRDNLIKLLKSI